MTNLLFIFFCKLILNQSVIYIYKLSKLFINKNLITKYLIVEEIFYLFKQPPQGKSLIKLFRS